MRKYTNVTSLALILSFMAFGSVAQAQEGDSYVAAAVGSATTTFSGFSASSTGFRVGYGKRTSENLAIEGYYISSGSGTITNQYYTDSYETFKASTTTFQVQAVGYVPMQPSMELFGKAGLAMWSTDWDYTDVYLGSLYATGSGKESGTNLVYGFGLDYKLQGGTKIRAEYEVLATKIGSASADVTTISVGFFYNL